MNKLFILSLITIVSLTSCSKEDNSFDNFVPLSGSMTLPTDSGLESTFSGDTLVITYNGAKYFPMQITIDDLSIDNYVNGVPLASTDWDTDYWYTITDGLYMWSSLYNPLASSYNSYQS